VDNPELKFEYLNEFDKAMLKLINEHKVLNALPAKLLNVDEQNRTLVFERANLIFVFNFHPTAAIFDYRFHVDHAGVYHTILCSDDIHYGGFGRIDGAINYPSTTYEHGHRLSIYNTNRTVIVLGER
jgi:1,4-alpha-glucan branching enzyme